MNTFDMQIHPEELKEDWVLTDQEIEQMYADYLSWCDRHPENFTKHNDKNFDFE